MYSSVSDKTQIVSSENDKISDLQHHFSELYAETPTEVLPDFIDELIAFKAQHQFTPAPKNWYKDAVVYSLYVDLYADNFQGLIRKLDYLSGLGVNVIWLLPVLDSPMRDAGFDISDYKMIRRSLSGLPESATDAEVLAVFQNFLDEAHKLGIRVIFDIALNHTSDQHPWFLESKQGEENPFRDFYIWNKDTDKYTETRLLFKGMCDSNWEASGADFYFHRFFEFQPDLNYRNPQVLLTMARTLLFWVEQGVDGFRADAIPYIWKEEGTDCENLDLTHTVVKFFRAVLDFVRPGTLLLAEACQPPHEVVKYMGEGDECHAAYHFPVMPQIFKALALQAAQPIIHTLSDAVTPTIPEDSQWFTFLRCHDELSLELVYVSEEDRAYIHKNYCHEPAWNFRVGEGISARMAELMQFDARKVGLAYAVMFSLPGTPVLYYGDEFGKANDHAYYQQQIQLTGKDDTRFLVRGRIDWQELEQQLAEKDSFQSQVFARIKALLRVRTTEASFGRGSLDWVYAYNENGLANPHILACTRAYNDKKVLVLLNLSDAQQCIRVDALPPSAKADLLNQKLVVLPSGELQMDAYQYNWIALA